MNRFDQVAKGYDTDRRKARSQAIAAMLRQRIPTDRPADGMEFGCGTGLVGFSLASALSSLLFVDSSAGMIDEVNKKIARQNDPSLRALCCDFMKTVPTGLEVDVIFSVLVLHHIGDTAHALSMLYRVLRPGGHLLLVDLDTDDGGFHAGDPGFAGPHGFDRDALTTLATAAGFSRATCDTCYQSTKPAAGREHPYSLFLLDAMR